MKQLIGAGVVVSGVIAIAMANPQAQQARKPAATKLVSGWIKTSTYVPAKTPWGDPDLQGGYSNVNENGIPFEKPGNLANRQVGEIDDSELAELARERNERALASAAGIGGRDTGAGPVHWYEHYNVRTAAPGWWWIRRTDFFRRRPRRRSSVSARGPAGAVRPRLLLRPGELVLRLPAPQVPVDAQAVLPPADAEALVRAVAPIPGSIAVCTIAASRVASPAR